MKIATDRYEFDVVYNGQWYRLASLSTHLKEKVPSDKRLLLDRLSRKHLVPVDQVHMPSNPIKDW